MRANELATTIQDESTTDSAFFGVAWGSDVHNWPWINHPGSIDQGTGPAIIVRPVRRNDGSPIGLGQSGEIYGQGRQGRLEGFGLMAAMIRHRHSMMWVMFIMVLFTTVRVICGS